MQGACVCVYVHFKIQTCFHLYSLEPHYKGFGGARMKWYLSYDREAGGRGHKNVSVVKSGGSGWRGGQSNPENFTFLSQSPSSRRV